MHQDTISEIELILTQEERAFHLIKLGFIVNIRQEVIYIGENILPTVSATNYQDWKSQLLHLYYVRRNFREFVQKHLENPLFISSIKNILRNEIRMLKEKLAPSDWDCYLCVKDDSISFSLAESGFQEIYNTVIKANTELLNDTKQIHLLCKKAVNEYYPLTDEFIISKLMENDVFVWSKIYTRLQQIIATMNLGDSTKISDIWSETCCILSNSLREGKITPIAAKALISYGVGIAKNKNREYVRQINRDVHSFTEDIEKYYKDEGVSQSDSIGHYIDEEGHVDNSLMLADILCNSNHPYRFIVSGLEDKLAIFMDHYLNKISYEEIAYENNKALNEFELKTEAARLRQEVSRFKTKIRERLMNLLNKRTNQ